MGSDSLNSIIHFHEWGKKWKPCATIHVAIPISIEKSHVPLE